MISTLASDPLLPRAIESCLSSLGHNDECVVHLDNCVEGRSYLPAFRDPRLIVLTTEERIGFSAGLNLAVSQSKSDLIFRLDADDTALKDRWKSQQRALEDCQIVSGLVVHRYAGSTFPKLIPHYPLALNSIEVSCLLPFSNPMLHPAVAFRKDVFKQLGGYGQAVAEDYELWLRAAISNVSIKRTMDYVTIYTHHPTQATRSMDWARKVADDPLILNLRGTLKSKLADEGIASMDVLERALRLSPFFRLEFRDAVRAARGHEPS